MSVDWDVLGFGAVTVDDLIYVDDYPPPGSKKPIQAQQRQGGGLTGTALVAAARLGARSAYAGVLGDDELSQFTLEELAHEGVDCRAVLRRSQARPIHSLVIVDQSTGQRTILYTIAGFTERRPEEISHELIASCRVLFVDHLAGNGGLRAVELAHAQGVPVVGDIEREDGPAIRDLMRRIDHLIVGVDLAERVTGENEPGDMARALSEGGRACVVVTAGEQGCWYVERGGQVQHCPAFQVQVVDTTGCGDVFHGAYAACIARGEGVDMAVLIATAAAGIKATQPGGRAGIPDRAAIDRFLRKNHAGK
ncbi:MAG: PfkB family carbohydrate kinase [Anaerolineae bacterium]